MLDARLVIDDENVLFLWHALLHLPVVLKRLPQLERIALQDWRAQKSRRQPDREDRATAIGAIFSPDSPAVRLDEAPADGQAQTHTAAAALPTSIDLIETLKD